jgi:hypothetical protein
MGTDVEYGALRQGKRVVMKHRTVIRAAQRASFASATHMSTGFPYDEWSRRTLFVCIFAGCRLFADDRADAHRSTAVSISSLR